MVLVLLGFSASTGQSGSFCGFSGYWIKKLWQEIMCCFKIGTWKIASQCLQNFRRTPSPFYMRVSLLPGILPVWPQACDRANKSLFYGFAICLWYPTWHSHVCYNIIPLLRHCNPYINTVLRFFVIKCNNSF